MQAEMGQVDAASVEFSAAMTAVAEDEPWAKSGALRSMVDATLAYGREVEGPILMLDALPIVEDHLSDVSEIWEGLLTAAAIALTSPSSMDADNFGQLADRARALPDEALVVERLYEIFLVRAWYGRWTASSR